MWGIADEPFWPGLNGSWSSRDLGVLQVADLGGEALEGAAEDRDRGEQRRVPVALDDLGADRIGVKTERGEDFRFDVGGEVAVRPDRTRDLAGADLVDRGGETRPATIDLERPPGELEAESRRLGVDRVGPAHHHGVRFSAGARDEREEQPVGVGQEPLTGGAELERESGVDHVAAGRVRGGGSGRRGRRFRRPG